MLPTGQAKITKVDNLEFRIAKLGTHPKGGSPKDNFEFPNRKFELCPKLYAIDSMLYAPCSTRFFVVFVIYPGGR